MREKPKAAACWRTIAILLCQEAPYQLSRFLGEEKCWAPNRVPLRLTNGSLTPYLDEGGLHPHKSGVLYPDTVAQTSPESGLQTRRAGWGWLWLRLSCSFSNSNPLVWAGFLRWCNWPDVVVSRPPNDAIFSTSSHNSVADDLGVYLALRCQWSFFFGSIEFGLPSPTRLIVETVWPRLIVLMHPIQHRLFTWFFCPLSIIYIAWNRSRLRGCGASSDKRRISSTFWSRFLRSGRTISLPFSLVLWCDFTPFSPPYKVSVSFCF